MWRFVADHLRDGRPVALLVVGDSSGSSPGRAGYKMAVAADGTMAGSIGGGVMEVALVEEARSQLSPPVSTTRATLRELVHRRNDPNSSGMICSGRQTVILRMLSPIDLEVIDQIVDSLGGDRLLKITDREFTVIPAKPDSQKPSLERGTDGEFTYIEPLGVKEKLYIIGGGHCALALSEVMSRLGFGISIFDDRPDLNTLQKNEFADDITIIESYERIGEHIAGGSHVYVAVMTLGYASDAIVIRQLIDNEVRYLGVLGSKAKMATLMKELREEGISSERLSRIHTPIGLPINSRTPEEIAVSIAAEIISIRNGV